MKAWIFVHNPLEHWMADYKRIFDAWDEGGIRGIVVGRMHFDGDDGKPIPTYDADPAVYESFGVNPPPNDRTDPAKRKQFSAMLDDATSRGWHVMIFSGPLPQGGSLPMSEDPYGARVAAAGAQDVMNAYPQFHGNVVDGPGENHYELAFHHGGELFEIRPHERDIFEHTGVDIARVERGIAHLRERFHSLKPSEVRYHAPGGMLAGMMLFDINEDVIHWLRARNEKSIASMAAVRAEYDKLGRKFELGGIPRAAAFASLTGQNYQRLGPILDYIFPKHYFWNRGFDGMYGTVARWVQRLSKWNPALTEEDCFDVVKLLFGIDLPGIRSVLDMDRVGFADEFFSETVYSETKRAMEAVGDPDRVVCWVDTGRCSHSGDQMPPADLHRILEASARAGLKQFVHHSSLHMGAAEWRVISSMCGTLWDEDPKGGYWPDGTQKPFEFNGGRTPPAED
jgi:hypothetical protein